MRNLLSTVIVGSGLLFCGLTANAQYRPDYRYQQREYRDPSRMLDRVRGDLNNLQADALPFTGDRYRINRLRTDVYEVQRDLANGEYDRQALDEVIASMQQLIDRGRLSQNSRDVLAGDLIRMRELRTRLDNEWWRW